MDSVSICALHGFLEKSPELEWFLAMSKEGKAGTAAVTVSCIFMLQMEQHVLKFAIDYRGRN